MEAEFYFYLITKTNHVHKYVTSNLVIVDNYIFPIKKMCSLAGVEIATTFVGETTV